MEWEKELGVWHAEDVLGEELEADDEAGGGLLLDTQVEWGGPLEVRTRHVTSLGGEAKGDGMGGGTGGVDMSGIVVKIKR